MVQRSMLKPGDEAWFRGNFSLNDVEPSNCVGYCTSRWCRLAGPISEAVGWLVCVWFLIGVVFHVWRLISNALLPRMISY